MIKNEACNGSANEGGRSETCKCVYMLTEIRTGIMDLIFFLVLGVSYECTWHLYEQASEFLVPRATVSYLEMIEETISMRDSN